MLIQHKSKEYKSKRENINIHNWSDLTILFAVKELSSCFSSLHSVVTEISFGFLMNT